MSPPSAPVSAPPFVRIRPLSDPADEAQSLRSMGLRSLRSIGLSVAGKGGLEASRNLFEAARTLAPQLAHVHNALGVINLRTRDWPQAWGAFKRAITINMGPGTGGGRGRVCKRGPVFCSVGQGGQQEPYSRAHSSRIANGGWNYHIIRRHIRS